MSTSSTTARTTFLLALIRARASRRASGNGAEPRTVSVVVNGCVATGAGRAGEGVEERRLAGIGETDHAEPFHLRRRYSPSWARDRGC